MTLIPGGLRARLMLLVAAASVPLVGLTLYTDWQQRRASIAQFNASTERTLATVVADEQRIVDGTRHLLSGFAALPEVRELRPDCSQLASTLLSMNPWLSNVGATAADGTLVCSGVAPPTDLVVERIDDPWWRRAVEERRLVIGEITKGRLTGRQVFMLASPVLADGQLRAVAFASIALDWFDRIASSSGAPDLASFLLLDGNGNGALKASPEQPWIAAQHPADAVFEAARRGGSGSVTATGGDGVERVYAYARVGDGDADQKYIVVGYPHVLAAAANSNLWNDLGVLALGIVIAVLAVWRVADRLIVAPVNQVISATSRLAFGDLSARVDESGSGEVAALGESFNRMAGTIQQQTTRRSAAEQEARKLAAIVESSLDPIIATDRAGHITAFNSGAVQMSGFTASEAIGRHVSLLVPSDRLGQWGEAVETLKSGQRTVHYETDWLSRDRRRVPVALSMSTIRDDQGAILGFSCIARDISSIRDAEASALDANFRLAQILETMPLAVLVCDASGRFILLNRACRALYASAIGLTPEERAARFPMYVGDSPTPCPANERPLARAMRGEQVHFVDARMVVEGQLIPLEIWASPIFDPHGQVTCVVQIAHDITQQRALEEQFRHSQKLEAVGRLAGGVAHDFNNLLTVILGYTDLLLEQAQESGEASRELQAIHEAGERARTLTAQLLAFGRKQVLQPRIVHVNELIRVLARMLDRVLGEDVGLSLRLREDAGRINVDPGQFDQLLMNVVVNARDAMPTGGELIIETDNVHVEHFDENAEDDLAPGSYVMIAVTDTGVGMTPETKARVFEPFFTTKDHGKGTGLGMATAYGIVRQSQGHIEIESELLRGTTVKVYFPAAESGVQADPAVEPRPVHSEGTETVLVVEDDRDVRRFTTLVLAARGYVVFSAEGRDEAMALLTDRPEGVDLLLTDVVLKGVNGRGLAAEVLTRWPDTRVLYMSGYTDSVIPVNELTASGLHFIQKPFTASVLAQTVRKILDDTAQNDKEQAS